jgi:hypothetical protein
MVPERTVRITRSGRVHDHVARGFSYFHPLSAVPIGSVAKFDFWGKIQKSGIRNSTTYRLPNSRKSNFATEPQRRQRIERQDHRLLDAYQAEILNLPELQTRRQKLAAELHQIAQESRQLAHTRHQSIHWQQVMDNTATFRQLLGENFAQLAFEERQAMAQCLISQVIVTGEAVDIHFVLPFASTPQAARRLPQEPEGTPGHFYRLRLAHFDGVEVVPTMGR